MHQPLVSIIVPVYQVRAYLPACLESLHAQSRPDLEILLVDDGSTDGSAALCDEMAEWDGRVRVIHKPNTGVSDARNQALAQARGKYIQFVDGDDRLAPGATQTLVRAAESTGGDLVIAHFYRVIGERMAPRGHIRGRQVLTRQEFALEMAKAPANYYYGVLWNKLYRRALLEKHAIRFETGISWCEDFLFNLEYLRHTRLIAAVPEPVYYYYKRQGSLVNSQAGIRRTIQTKKLTFDYYKDLYQDLDLYDARKARVYRYLISSATDGAVFPMPEALEELLGRRVE